jgi:prepilin signal peptidase PulO-like enzyme (type II secretory pathway)
MRVEARVMIGVGIFFAVVLAVYWFTSYEAGGTVMLFFTILLGLLPGSYFLWWSRRMPPRPEDNPDATMEEGSGTVGSFPEQSIWPLTLGAGCALCALSLVFGLWFAILGAALAFGAAAGYTIESRRGGTV